jgi:hypothetical protein
MPFVEEAVGKARKAKNGERFSDVNHIFIDKEN